MGSSCSRTSTSAPEAKSKARRDSERRGLRQGLVHERKHANVYDFYEVVKEVGHGMTGKVFQVVHRQTRERYALKCMEVRRIDTELLDDLRNEIALLKLVDHPNVIKLFEFFEDPQNIYLILELCDGGELFDRLHAQTGSHYDEAQAARLMYQMCAAIAYCHFQGISHRDLKLENFIFESKAADSELKLIDFGLSHKYGTSLRRMHTMVGTPYYIAPEVLLQSAGSEGYTSACDVWSLGVIAYMLLSGTPPFRGKRDREVLEAVRRGKFSMSGPKWDAVSDSAKDFVRSLLVFNPAKRPTTEQALKHRWLQRCRSAEAPRPLDAAVLSSLREFSKLSAFKRAALEAIAFSLSAQSIRDLREQFSGLDADAHGVVSVQQFCDVLTRSGATRDEAVAIFRSIDQAHNESISYTEFLAASLGRRLLLTRDRIRDAFQRMDVDGTGFITRQNLKVLLGDEWTPEKVEAMMAEVDAKGDGRIDFDEFLGVVAQEGWREADGLAALPATPSTSGGARSGVGGGIGGAFDDSRPPSALSNGGPTPMSVLLSSNHGGGGLSSRFPEPPPRLGQRPPSTAPAAPPPPPRRHTGDGSELGTAALFRLGGVLADGGGSGRGGAAAARTGLSARLLEDGGLAGPTAIGATDTRLVVPSALVDATGGSGDGVTIFADRTQSDDTAFAAAALRRLGTRPPLPPSMMSGQVSQRSAASSASAALSGAVVGESPVGVTPASSSSLRAAAPASPPRILAVPVARPAAAPRSPVQQQQSLRQPLVAPPQLLRLGTEELPHLSERLLGPGDSGPPASPVAAGAEPLPVNASLSAAATGGQGPG